MRRLLQCGAVSVFSVGVLCAQVAIGNGGMATVGGTTTVNGCGSTSPCTLANGSTTTTQTQGDGTGKVATDLYVDTGLVLKLNANGITTSSGGNISGAGTAAFSTVTASASMATPNLANVRYVDPTGALPEYPTIQAAINSLPTAGNQGGVIYLQPGTYTSCPTNIPSGVQLRSQGGTMPPNNFTEFNGASFNSYNAGPATAALVIIQCPSGLTLQDANRIALDRIVIDLQGTGNMYIKGVVGSYFDMSVVNAAITAPALTYDGDTANQFGSGNNHFQELYLNGGNVGLQVGNDTPPGGTSGGMFATESIFDHVVVEVSTQPSGTYKGVYFVGNCDSLIFHRIALFYTSAVTAIDGLVYGSSATADTDADLIKVDWYDETGNPTGTGYNPTGYSIFLNYATNDYVRTGVLMGRSGNIGYGTVGTGTYDTPWIWWDNQGVGTPAPFGASTTVPSLKLDQGAKGTPGVAFQKQGVIKSQLYIGGDDNLYLYSPIYGGTGGDIAEWIDSSGIMDVFPGLNVGSSGQFSVGQTGNVTLYNSILAVDNSSATNVFLVQPATGNTAIAGTLDAYQTFTAHGDASIAGNAQVLGQLNLGSSGQTNVDNSGNITLKNGSTTTAQFFPATGNAALVGTLDVYQAVTAHNNETVDGTFNVTGAVNFPNIGPSSGTDCLQINTNGAITNSGAPCSGATWPTAAGIAVYSGSSTWGASLTAPAGSIVGTTDTQTLTNKTLDGVTPTVMSYVDPTSSIQTQINGKASSTAATTVNGTTCTLGASCTLPVASASVSGTAQVDGKTLTATAGVLATTLAADYQPPFGGGSTLALATGSTRVYWVPMLQSVLAPVKLTYTVTTADNTANLYDVGFYGPTGTLLCHLGATAGTAFSSSTGIKTLNFASQCSSNLISGTRYYFAFTTNCTASCAVLGGLSSGQEFSPVSGAVPTAGAATTGGVLNSSITLPSDSWGALLIPNMALHQ